MDASATFGRVIDTELIGNANGSYAVPAGRFALIEVACIRTTSSGYGTTITVDGTTRNSYSSFPSSTVWASDFAIVDAGSTVSWAFSATATTKFYRILVLYKATPP